MRIYWFSLLLLNLSFYTAAEYSLVKSQKQRFIIINDHGEPLAAIIANAFKPQWQWLGSEHKSTEQKDTTTIETYELDNANIQWQWQFTPNNEGVHLRSRLVSKVDVPLTYLSLAIQPDVGLKGGQLIATDRYQKITVVPIPLRTRNLKDIVHLQFQDKYKQEQITVNFNQPIDIHVDWGARIKLADKQLPAQQVIEHQFQLSTPKALAFYKGLNDIPQTTDHSQWFAFKTSREPKSGVIGMEDWLSQRTTPLSFKGDKVFSGDAIYRAWGTNVNFAHNAPSRKIAVRRAKFFAKHGINSVRLHKLSNVGWEGLGSKHSATQYDPKQLEKFDYWTYQLKQQGIAYGLSPIWDVTLRPDDKSNVLAYDEIVKKRPNKPVTTGLVWFAEDIQKLHIENLTNLLTHKNPHTTLRYADDPAVDFVEIQNEENIFFYTFIANVRKYPTYHQLLAKQFSQWLRNKYGDHSRLVAHWGQAAINTFKHEGGLPDEHLSKDNITPVLTPWLYDHHGTSGFRAKRLQDSAEFLFFKQQEYYEKASAAIRDTGYQGLIISSNWQAGNKGAHFLNLLGDSQIGVVDRHNYQGGAKGNPGHLMKSGFGLNNYTMLGAPGSGLLSLGMQQLSNHPFAVSEWLAVVPSEWAAADTTIVAAYGFGLQGWDMSYHFASDGDQFSQTLGNYQNKFNNLTPVGLGLYPVLSRMVLRGDIHEGDIIATRRLSQKQALENRYDFENTLDQTHDIKSFNGTPDHSALAAGKVLIEFTDKDSTSNITPWEEKYQTGSSQRSVITSSTKQLRWTSYPGTHKGYIEINSQGTQGLVGFHQAGKDPVQFDFQDMSIAPQSPYSVILATAKAADKTLSNANEVLVVALARAHNTGMNLTKGLIANVGKAPILLEPIKASLTFKRLEGTVDVLDHNGVPTGKSYPLDQGVFHLDTGRDKTLYYRVRF